MAGKYIELNTLALWHELLADVEFMRARTVLWLRERMNEDQAIKLTLCGNTNNNFNSFQNTDVWSKEMFISKQI